MQCMQISKRKFMNRILVSILLTMGFVLCVSAQEKEYQLVWSDEFDVEGKPSTEWSYESGITRKVAAIGARIVNTFITHRVC